MTAPKGTGDGDVVGGGLPIPGTYTLFPQDRFSYRFGDDDVLLSSRGQRLWVYEDKDLTVLATITSDQTRKPYYDSVITVEETSLLPRFWETSGKGLTRLWARSGVDTTAYMLESMFATQVEQVQQTQTGMLRPPRTFVQPDPASVWVVDHDLGYDPPAVNCLDDSGVPFLAERHYTVPGSQFTIVLGRAAAGSVTYK